MSEKLHFAISFNNLTYYLHFRMVHLVFPLPEMGYDAKHRAHLMVDEGTDIGSGNVLPTAPGWQRRRNDPFSPAEQRRRRR